MRSFSEHDVFPVQWCFHPLRAVIVPSVHDDDERGREKYIIGPFPFANALERVKDCGYGSNESNVILFQNSHYMRHTLMAVYRLDPRDGKVIGIGNSLIYKGTLYPLFV